MEANRYYEDLSLSGLAEKLRMHPHVIAVALINICLQVIKAALANPVKSLRTE